MDLWVNTFGLSKPLKKDFAGALARLRAAGVTGLEPCVVFSPALGRMRNAFCRCGFAFAGLGGGNWFGRTAYELTGQALEAGLTIKSAHCALANMSPEVLRRTAAPAVAYAETFGLRFLVVSLVSKSPAAAAPFADALRRFAETAAEKGLTLLYHNHAAEFDGALASIMDVSPALGLELDVGWALYAGYDPVAIIREYADRIKVLHLKDVRVGARGKNKFAAVGEGDLPLAAVLRSAAELPVAAPPVIDQDASRGDIIADVRRGAENIRRVLCDSEC